MAHKTRITEIEVVNDKLYESVARNTKETVEDVRNAVKFTGSFIADVISEGKMQGVMLPYFGKFQPKPKVLAAMKEKRMHHMQGVTEVVKALKGIAPGPSEITIRKQKKRSKNETL
jgi:nucleoid DNA-binding protein